MARNLLASASSVIFLALIVTVLPGNALGHAMEQFSITTGSPNVATIGSKSHFGDMFLDQEFVVTEDAHNMKNWDQVTLLYLNANAMLSKLDFVIASNALRAGVSVLIDGTTDHDPRIMESISARIGGVGFGDALIMIRSPLGKIAEYKVMFVEGTTTESAASEEYNEQELSKLAIQAGKYLSQWLEAEEDVEPQAESYRPEATIAVEFHTTMKCRVGANYAGDGLGGKWTGEEIEDACNGGGSGSLFFNIDLIRSVPYSGGGDNNAENAKYVRITLNPETGGGAGWHLVTNPTHKHTWFQSWANRNCLFYPIAMNYGMEITPNDNSVRVYNTVPNNVPREMTVAETTGFSVGVEAGGEVGVGAEGPKAGASVGASFQYSSSKRVTYQVKEYTIENQSNDNRAKWIWDRKWDQYSSDWRSHGTCALWCQEWFWKDSAFSAAAYANYKPGFSTTFRASPHKSGTTRFSIKPSILIVSLGGRVQYSVFYQTYSPWAYTGYTHSFTKHFDINWDAPVFQPEIPVSIEVINYPGETRLCLDIHGNINAAGTAVISYGCHYEKNQLFGMDEFQRYKSRVGPNLCMEAKSDGSVTIESCTTSSQRQRWQWSGNNLMNTAGGYLAIVNGQVRVTTDTSVHRDFDNYVRKPGVEGAITVY